MNPSSSNNVTLPPLRSLDLLYLTRGKYERSPFSYNPSPPTPPPRMEHHLPTPAQSPVSSRSTQKHVQSQPQQSPQRPRRISRRLPPSAVSALPRDSNMECQLRPCPMEDAEALIVVIPKGAPYPIAVPSDTRALLVIGPAMKTYMDPRNTPQGTRVHSYKFRRD